MESVQKLKEKLQLNNGLADLMDVLRGVAISEFWALAKKQGRFTRFMNAFNGFFDLIDFSSVRHPYAEEKGRLAILMVTSNEGFMGGLNMRVINKALDHPEADKAELIIVGEQGAGYLKSLQRRAVTFPGIAGDETFEMSVQLRDYIVKAGRAGGFGRLTVYYPKPVSFMVQKVEEFKMLPCTELFQKRTKAPPPDNKQAQKSSFSAFLAGDTEELIIESPLHDMIEYLAEIWMVQKLYEIFEDSRLAELSARTVHLEESYQLLVQRGRGIRHQYFRSYHEFVDKGMRDIFAAQIVRRKSKRKQAVDVGRQT